MAWTWAGMAKDIALALTRTSFIALVIAGAQSVQRLKHRGTVSRRVPACPESHYRVMGQHGVVNTASMLWPEGQNMLVAADHGRIAGSATVDGRYRKSDLLEIGSTEAERGPSRSAVSAARPRFPCTFGRTHSLVFGRAWCPQRRPQKIAPSTAGRMRSRAGVPSGRRSVLAWS
jgi:hypothetical protein